MNTRLLLITDGFPYGTVESFLETEIEYLSQGFEEVIILSVTNNINSIRHIPQNVKVVNYYPKQGIVSKLTALLQIFNFETWKELKYLKIKYNLKLTKGILATLLVSQYNSKKIAQEINPFIHAKTTLYSYWCNDSALALAHLKKNFPHTKTISRAHGWDVYFEASAINYLPFRTLINQRLDLILPISEKGKDYIHEVWKVNDIQKIQVARLGVKEGKPQQLEGNKFTLVSCSNVIVLKRLALIIEALQHLETDVEWIHFGDGPLLEEIKSKAKNLAQNISVNFMGHKSNTEVLDFYTNNKVHLFINVSSTEGIPVSIMEAMSFGIPCIATDVGGNSEIVNNENGRLISSNPSPKEIAATLTGFANMEREEWKEYSNQAYETWKTKFNAKVNYEDFLQKLENI